MRLGGMLRLHGAAIAVIQRLPHRGEDQAAQADPDDDKDRDLREQRGIWIELHVVWVPSERRRCRCHRRSMVSILPSWIGRVDEGRSGASDGAGSALRMTAGWHHLALPRGRA